MLQVTNVRLPNATSIGEEAFLYCCALRHITLHPNVNIDGGAIAHCLSLKVIAACAGFKLDTGDRTRDGRIDPTVAITRYLKSQCKLDTQQRDVFLTYNFMLKLCNHHIYKKTGVVRARSRGNSDTRSSRCACVLRRFPIREKKNQESVPQSESPHTFTLSGSAPPVDTSHPSLIAVRGPAEHGNVLSCKG